MIIYYTFQLNVKVDIYVVVFISLICYFVWNLDQYDCLSFILHVSPSIYILQFCMFDFVFQGLCNVFCDILYVTKSLIYQ